MASHVIITGFRWFALLLLWFVALLAVAWAAAALYIDLPVAGWGLPGALGYLALTLAALVLAPGWRAKLGFCVAGAGVVLGCWLLLEPSNDRNWQPDVAQTAWAEINGDKVTIHNVRNFDYRSETDYDPRWETRTYDLSQIRAVDFFLTYWGSPWIAHPIASFEFADGTHVAFSIETRKEVGEEYSALLGFFRQYELIYIVADERDVIRLRTNYRVGEDVYLYRTKAGPETARALFLSYVQSVDELHRKPVFYNALTSNCTSNIRVHTTAIAGYAPPPWDWRLLLSGKADEFAYQYGRLSGNLPFDALKQQAHINDAARAADSSPDFSVAVRRGRAGFEQP